MGVNHDTLQVLEYALKRITNLYEGVFVSYVVYQSQNSKFFAMIVLDIVN